jgi:hypothetical protein
MPDIGDAWSAWLVTERRSGRMGVAKREVGLLVASLVLLDATGGESPCGRRLVRLGAGDGENVAIGVEIVDGGQIG